jgi:hypothetical protein
MEARDLTLLGKARGSMTNGLRTVGGPSRGIVTTVVCGRVTTAHVVMDAVAITRMLVHSLAGRLQNLELALQSRPSARRRSRGDASSNDLDREPKPRHCEEHEIREEEVLRDGVDARGSLVAEGHVRAERAHEKDDARGAHERREGESLPVQDLHDADDRHADADHRGGCGKNVGGSDSRGLKRFVRDGRLPPATASARLGTCRVMGRFEFA